MASFMAVCTHDVCVCASRAQQVSDCILLLLVQQHTYTAYIYMYMIYIYMYLIIFIDALMIFDSNSRKSY